jgi:hypothetical protein
VNLGAVQHRNVLQKLTGLFPSLAPPASGIDASCSAAVRRRGSFLDVDSAMRVLFLTICQRGKNRPKPTRRINNCTTIFNGLT